MHNFSHTKITKEKIRQKLKGRKLSKKAKEKVSIGLLNYYKQVGTKHEWITDKKGKKRILSFCSCGTKKDARAKLCRKCSYNEEFSKKISNAKKGKISPNKGKKLIWMIGPKNPKWKGGITPITNKRVGRIKWKELRIKIWERDKHTCQICGNKNCKLVAHHKIPYRISKNDSPNNLISLCSKCHTLEEWRLESYANRI